MAGSDFEVKLVKGDVTTTGLSVVWPDQKALLVREVKPEGLVAMYNAGQEDAANKILTGDTIVAVNGVKEDPKAMLQEIADKTNIECQVKRAGPEVRGGLYYYLELKKTAECKKTGLTVRWPDEKSLVIKAILEEGGLVPQWIKDNPDAAVKPQVGDAIIEVNSIQGSHGELMDMLGKNDNLKLTIFRAPPPPAEQPAEAPKEAPPQEEPAAQPEPPKEEPPKEEPAPEENKAPAEDATVAEPAAEPAAEPKTEAENVIGLEPGETDASTTEKKSCGCF